MRWPLVGLLLAGCGRIGFDAGSLGDGQLGDGQSRDTAVTTYRDVVMGDHPVAYYRFADTGTTALDETGQFNGTYMGTCTPIAGALTADANPALHLDGVSCLIMLGDVLKFPGSAPFSIEAWTRAASNATTQIIFMNETRIGVNPMDGYALLFTSSGLYLERIANQAGENTDKVPMPVGRYVHIVVTYDGTQERIFLDGAEAGVPHPESIVLATYSANASIGAFESVSNVIDGDLDEFAIYGDALPPERIAAHHAVGINGPIVGN